MTQTLRGKDRSPNSIRYDAWATFPIVLNSATTATFASTAVQGVVPLGLNTKITHVSYSLSGTSFAAGKIALNIVNGSAAYESAGGASSYGYVTLSGTFSAGKPASNTPFPLPYGDTITVTIGGLSYTKTVNGRDAGNNQLIAADLASGFNNNTTVNGLYRANSAGSQIVFQTLAYGATTPTFSVTVSSAAGTATASGATFVAGVAGTNPVLGISDQLPLGQSPSATAALGNALFPANIVLPEFTAGQANQPGIIYALESQDVIWGPTTQLTARITTDGTVAGVLTVTLYGKPVDNHPTAPQSNNSSFRLTQANL